VRQQTADSGQQTGVVFVSAVCCLLSAVWGCKKEPLIPPRPSPAEIRAAHIAEAGDDSWERTNLLNMARGAAVVSRTGEFTLENSALRAIDGDPNSNWLPPQDDPQQTLTFSLGTRSRIDSVGASTSLRTAVKTIRFESSLDGKTFTPLITQTVQRAWGPQVVDVKPVEASFVRASIIDGYSSIIDLRSLIARGAEVAPAQPRSIAGCWSLNTFPAAIFEKGGTAYGWFDQRERMWLDGGFDGRVWRFVWTRGPQYGLIAFTMSPDNLHASGLKWFEDADPHNVGDSLFGDRRPCTTGPPEYKVDVLRTYLERHSFVPLYGLHFDDANQFVAGQSGFAISELARLIEDTAPRPLQIVSRELRGADASADLAVSKARLDSLHAELQREKIDLSRVTFVAAGRADYHTAVWSEIMRTMQSGIELGIPR